MKFSELAIDDGAKGVLVKQMKYTKTKHQRCWVDKTVNILNKSPKVFQSKAKNAVHEIWMADTKNNQNKAMEFFIETYQDKYLKTEISLHKDRIESTFVTI